MGISSCTLHIYGAAESVNYPLSFRRLSPEWLSCVERIEEWEILEHAEKISRLVDTPVLIFGIEDSDSVWFGIYRRGELVARHVDGMPEMRIGLDVVPALVGYAGEQMERLESMLRSGDAEEKLAMLEEYFGVCLVFWPELLDEPELLCRMRGDEHYRRYTQAEQALWGDAAPIALRCVAEYSGKLFCKFPGGETVTKPDVFLYGFGEPGDAALTPVRFAGGELLPCPEEGPTEPCAASFGGDSRFVYVQSYTAVRFAEGCPAAFLGRTMPLPSGAFPLDFTPSGKLILRMNGQVYFADETLHLVARQPVCGYACAHADGYLLTTVGSSFFFYGYDPDAKIYIYAIE